MNKYHFDIKINDKLNNAGTKATEDCKNILLNYGYKNLDVSFIKTPILLPYNLVKLILLLSYYAVTIPSKSLFVVQYPLKGINYFFRYFISLLKLKGCRFSCIIHDLDSLRSDYNKANIEKEIKTLNAYDAVISHNSCMSEWLRGNGFTKHIEEIILFDYLTDKAPKKNLTKFDNQNITVAFAGSLKKADFIKDMLHSKLSFVTKLYGNLSHPVSEKNEQVKWMGSFATNEIVEKIDADFGLVWDGDNMEDISGLMGNYIKFNTPHKTSLYLVSGIPIIISKKAAIAKFIIENNLGLCIDRISSIESSICIVEYDEYERLKVNVKLIARKLSEGWFLKNVLTKVENYFSSL